MIDGDLLTWLCGDGGMGGLQRCVVWLRLLRLLLREVFHGMVCRGKILFDDRVWMWLVWAAEQCTLEGAGLRCIFQAAQSIGKQDVELLYGRMVCMCNR